MKTSFVMCKNCYEENPRSAIYCFNCDYNLWAERMARDRRGRLMRSPRFANSNAFEWFKGGIKEYVSCKIDPEAV
jgi:ribosomal protein L40E